MEGRKQSGSSLASDLFGAKDSSATPSSSSALFSSIFAPPASKGLGHETLYSSETEKKNDPRNPAWNANPSGVSDKNAVGGEDQSRGMYYEDQKVQQPCHYSSSIYYGGQDVYSRPQDPQNPGITTFSKDDGGEDDPGSASRGNWWQGSLYY